MSRGVKRWWGRTNGGTDPSLSSGVLGVRLLALSAVAAAGVLLLSGRIHGWLLVLGISAGATLAGLQHLAVRRERFAVALSLVIPQAAVWTLLIHATAGRASPFILAYLLEPPLAGLLFGPLGLIVGSLAVALSSVSFPEIFPRAHLGTSIALWLVVIAAFTALSGPLVLAVRRRRELAHGLQRSLQEEMKLLIESLNGALLGIDERGRIETLNLSGARLLSSGRTLVGKPWQEVLRVDALAHDRILESLVTGAVQRALPLTLDGPAGDQLAMRAEIWPSPGFTARRTYVLLEPETATNPEDPIRRLGEAATCVAHQIKNSVHALQGMVETGSPAGTRDAVASEYREGLRSLGTLAEDVLAFSGRTRAELQSFSIQDAVRAARVLLGDAPIHVCAPEAPLAVIAHRCQLVHAIFNLLDNARRVTPPGGHVEVLVRREDEWVTLDIIDRGPGISPALAAARQPVASATGTGLGLLTARRFVEDSGGQLTIDGAEGGGTRCRLTLPFAGDEPRSAAQPVAIAASAEPAT